MRHFLVATSFLLLTISTYSQTPGTQPQPCTLKLSQAPSVRGVKLDMTVDQLLPLFPGSSDDAQIKRRLSESEGYPNFGEASFFIQPSNYSPSERFAGIANYLIRVFDRRVVGVEVDYDRFPRGPRWTNVDDLVQKFADSLHLPSPKNWEPSGDTARKLKCDGFDAMASANGDGSSIGFHNLRWVQTKKDRSAAFEEQKRREFKP